MRLEKSVEPGRPSTSVVAGPLRGYELTALGRAALDRGAARAELRPLLEALADGARPLRTLERREKDAARRLETLRRDGLVKGVSLESGAVRTPQVRVASVTAGATICGE